MNTFRNAQTVDSLISPIYLAFTVGHLRCCKQWFQKNDKIKPLPSSNLDRFLKCNCEKSSHSKVSWSVPDFLILTVSECIMEKYRYLREKIPNLLPQIIANAQPTKTNTSTLAGRRDKFNFIAEVAEIAAPAVVFIEIRDKRRIDPRTKQAIPISHGSGFIVDPNGLILTNAHVIVDSNLTKYMSLSVKLINGQVFEGVIETVDTLSDLATVRVNGKNLPSLKLGYSAELKPGEWVVALGSPLSMSNTITCGVISAHRRSEELGLFRKQIVYLQTNALINQGNSGGPLLNLDAEAIGVNCMKILPGISFAIPVDQVKVFLEYKGSDRNPIRYIGMTMMSISEAMITELRRRSCGLPERVKGGVLVWKVMQRSPAERGGLHPGDIITHVNGVEVKSSVQIYEALAEKGKPLDLVVYRGQKELKILVKPDE